MPPELRTSGTGYIRVTLGPPVMKLIQDSRGENGFHSQGRQGTPLWSRVRAHGTVASHAAATVSRCLS